MHQAIQRYQANKAEMDTNHFISFFRRRAETNPHVTVLLDTPEYKDLVGLITDDNPFKEIQASVAEFSLDELTWLDDNMPSGYARATVEDEIEKRVRDGFNEKIEQRLTEMGAQKL